MGQDGSWDGPSIFRSSGSTARRHLDRALDVDGRTALRAVRCLTQDDLPWLEERAVRAARSDGEGWATIARLLGRARQGVWGKYRHVDATPTPPPLRPTTLDERTMSWVRTSRADARRRREFDDAGPGDVIAW